MSAYFESVPASYFDLLIELPEINRLKNPNHQSCDFIHLFAKDLQTYLMHYDSLKDSLKFTGMFWVSWPKKSSKLSSDINENLIRNHALNHGLVDVKVCAIDNDWSGLKLMYRKSDRN